MNESFSLSVAPMMERTDRHFRYLIRLVSPNARLYTEMITSASLLHGDAERFLAFDASEHPVAVQLGGNDPEALRKASRLAAEVGYDEINLNVGCPSGRVQAGDFGARLMLDPRRVADCVTAMREGAAEAQKGSARACRALPVSVKTRIGVDHHDDYGVLCDLTASVVAAGVSRLIVHARKAWLKGLSPKENREIPPLDYPRVHCLKRDFPELPIEINGGFTSETQVLAQRGRIDGVMLGRAAYADPMLIARLDRLLFGRTGHDESEPSVIIAQYADYMRKEQARGTPLNVMSRHLMGLFANRPGARQWRRRLSELGRSNADVDKLVAELAGQGSGTRYNARSTGGAAHSFPR